VRTASKKTQRYWDETVPASAIYRNRAAECERRAAEARHPEIAKQYVEMAAEWRVLATQAERREKGPSGTPWEGPSDS
jgi:hypothetical protein